MRTAILGCLFCACAALPLAAQRQWEIGALGGASISPTNTVSAGSISGNVGFRPGFSAGAWLGHNSTEHFTGEIRYLFQRTDQKVSSGGTSATFSAWSHVIQYDFLVHTKGRDARVRPFFVVGGGLRGYIGTGTEHATQPLSNLAILSKTSEWKPVVSVGGGVKWAVAPNTMVTVDVRDYINQFPKNVILPSPGATVKGWVHSITPTVGISYSFY